MEQDSDGTVQQPKCDFCSDPQVAWRYPCDTFRRDEEVPVRAGPDSIAGEIRVIDHGYVGDWIACSPCHDVYEEGGLEALVARVVDQWGMKDPVLREPAGRERLAQSIRALYSHFQMHRVGDAVPYQRK